LGGHESRYLWGNGTRLGGRLGAAPAKPRFEPDRSRKISQMASYQYVCVMSAFY
jgi:hypothetical protein